MRKWLRQWLFPTYDPESSVPENRDFEFQFPSLREMQGTSISIKQINNGFLLAFNTEDEDDWRQKVTFCKTPDDIAHEIVRYFTVKTVARR